jgi:putative hydrolases of HD superfamily
MKAHDKSKTFEESVIALFENIHPLDQVQRAGYVLRGIASPESVSAHSHFVSLLTLLFVEQYPESFDREKALAMAIVHDLPEAILMDIPMPASVKFLKTSKKDAEKNIFDYLFHGALGNHRKIFEEFMEQKSPEARLVAGLDKAQMMIKILCYQQEGRGRLSEFWLNHSNFDDHGIIEVSRLFDEICRVRGVRRPVAE